jgi:hypothetical protein
MRPHLLDELRDQAVALGLNLFGVVDADRFDACQPKELRVRTASPRCGTIVVLATGGRLFWQEYQRAPAAHGGASADQFALAGAQQIAQFLAAQLVPSRVVGLDGVPCVNVARLGEAAGFGTVSPVSGLLLKVSGDESAFSVSTTRMSMTSVLDTTPEGCT